MTATAAQAATSGIGGPMTATAAQAAAHAALDEGKADAAPDSGAAGEAGASDAMVGMQQLMSSVKMIVMLQPMLEPLKKKIEATVQHMQPEEAEKAMGIMKHILAL